MSRLVFAFLRHGDYHQLVDTPSAWQPFALNEAGINQAESAPQKLLNIAKQLKLSIHSQLDSSHLLRAWQTAEIIAKSIKTENYTIQSYDALAERGVGSVANLTISDIENIVDKDPRLEPLPQNWKSDSYFRLPFQGAESLMDAGERVAEHIKHSQQQLINTLTQDTLKLIIGHGASFRHAAHHLGLLKFDEIKKLSMYHADPIFIEYTKEAGWQHIAGNWKIRKLQSQFKD